MLKVSIVTSVYNKSQWLEKCLKSFINQTIHDIQFIIVNNGSTDNSLAIVEKFANVDSRFILINLKDNIGPSAAYALGINNVKTEYFALCDSDDFIPNDYIEILLSKIESNNADISMCTNDMVWDSGKVSINKRPNKGRDIIFTSKDATNLLPQIIDHHSNIYLGYYLSEVGALWGKLYRTDFVKKLSINYDPNIWLFCDWVFNFYLIKNMNKMVYTEDTIYHFYQSSGSFTRSKKMDWNECSRRKIALDKFETLCIDFRGNSVIALIKFYYGNIMSIIDRYAMHYQREVSKKDLNDIVEEISCWKQLDYIIEHKMVGLNLIQKLFIYFVKNKISFPFVFKAVVRKLGTK